MYQYEVFTVPPIFDMESTGLNSKWNPTISEQNQICVSTQLI